MKNLILIFSLIVMFLGINGTTANAQTPSQIFDEICTKAASSNTTGYEIVAAFNASTIRKNSTYTYSHTGHGASSLYPSGSNKLVATVDVAFSDRSYFQGAKDRTTIEIYKVGSTVRAKLILNRWGNTVVNLSNVKLEKKQFGYFLTGEKTDGRSNVKYTIAMFSSMLN